MLYAAPINMYSNYVFRHILLKHKADYVFSEVIMLTDLAKMEEDGKFMIIPSDIPKTIFQIGVSTPEQIEQAVFHLHKHFKEVKEININMGCPQSSMQKEKICSGILFDIELMGILAKKLSSFETFIPSVKLRLGTNEDTIRIETYLNTLSANGVHKVYIHTRPLKYSYMKPALPHYFEDLEKKFPKMTLIYNGDIDSPQSCKKYRNVLIGRAHLSNPLIFEDIKENISYRDGPYDPIVKDPHLIRGDFVTLDKKKKDFIFEYLDVAVKENLRLKLLYANVDYMCKGISDYSELKSKIKTMESPKEIREAFEIFFKEK